MNDITRRDFFAANADTSWINRGSVVQGDIDNAHDLTGVPKPSVSDKDAVYNFWVRVEIAWRWKFADLMHDGFDTTRG